MGFGFGRRDMTQKECACGKRIKGSSGFAMHVKTCEKAKSASAETKAVKEATQ
jgi:hypothetical protein